MKDRDSAQFWAHEETPSVQDGASGDLMSRYHTARSYRTRCAQRAQIAVQRESVLRKATRTAQPNTRKVDGHPSARILDRGDHVLVIGVLTLRERERLSVTHVEQHRHRNGVAWFPKEVSDAA